MSVCGDAAADPVAVPLLLGLGVRSLSVSPRAVPAVKAVVRGLDLAACRDLAQLALTLTDAGQVRDLVRSRSLSRAGQLTGSAPVRGRLLRSTTKAMSSWRSTNSAMQRKAPSAIDCTSSSSAS